MWKWIIGHKKPIFIEPDLDIVCVRNKRKLLWPEKILFVDDGNMIIFWKLLYSCQIFNISKTCSSYAKYFDLNRMLINNTLR